MNGADTAGLIRETLMVALELGGPLLAIAMAVGLVISILQAVTQINETTLSFVPKLIGLCLTFAVMAPMMFARLHGYMQALIDRVVAIGTS
jgi:flagellar biosynthesis protein FliQ